MVCIIWCTLLYSLPLALLRTRSAGAKGPFSECCDVRLDGLVLIFDGGDPFLVIFLGTEGRISEGDL